MKKLTLIIVLFFLNYSFAIEPPTGSTNQYFCNSNSWTLEDLTVNSSTGQVFWFGENDNSGVQLPISTNLTNGTTYFAFESTNISDISLEITVYLLAEIPAPESDFFGSPCILEEGNITLADLNVFNTNGFSTIYWFVENNSSGNPLPSNTIVFDNYSYYAFQGLGDCAFGIEVIVNFGDKVPAPEGESIQYFCESENATLADLAVFNTVGFSNIFWFSDETQTIALTPSTLIENGVTYYAFQGIGGECILSLSVTTFIQDIMPAPLGDTIYCIENGTLSDLAIFNTDGFTNIFFYADASQNQPISPSTTIVSGTTYFAFQVVGCDCGCINFLTFTVYDIESCPNAGINNNELDSFFIYPNPVKDILTINVSNLISDFKIVIHDIRGRKVYDNDFSLKEDIVSIPVSNLEAKVYFVSLVSENKLKTKKFIKQY